MAILPRLNYRFNAIAIKIPFAFLAKIDKLILKFKRKCKNPRIAKTLKKKKIGGLTLSNFKT